MPKNVGDLGKLIVAKGFKKLPKVQKNRQIWSHCMCQTGLQQVRQTDHRRHRVHLQRLREEDRTFALFGLGIGRIVP